MIIVKIIGGLGNQMFQYAFAYSISKKRNEIFKLDISGFKNSNLREYELELYNTKAEYTSSSEANELKYENETFLKKMAYKIFRKKRKNSLNYYKESEFNFDENVYKVNNDVYYEGYWQSEKYFKEYRNELLQQFTLKNELSLQTQVYEKEIIQIESVSLHIRRGDYISNKHTNSVHGVCDIEYYKNAVKEIKTKIKNTQFFIFSDDILWSKENLDFIENITFVELSEKIPPHEEIYLMSQCKHNIIANSSFSWWGAWLNQNDKKIVIAPKKWFADESINTSDLIPSNWSKI